MRSPDRTTRGQSSQIAVSSSQQHRHRYGAWTKGSLRGLIQEKTGDQLFVVVSNTEPCIHTFSGEEVECRMMTNGVVAALHPVMCACRGTWIAHGSGNADKAVVDSHDRVRVIASPEDAGYTLRRVWLSPEEVEQYYCRVSDEALWPLCHVAFVRPKFSKTAWGTYRRVNRLFADAVLQEVGHRRAIVFIQDYHLALLSTIIKKRNAELYTVQFWHIPWPSYEIFRICPWHEEILKGLLGNDLLGFQTRYDRDKFLDCVERSLRFSVDRKLYAVNRRGKTTLVRWFPIGVDSEAIAERAAAEEVEDEMGRLRRELELTDKHVGVSVERVDYIKGIPERLMALDKFFEKYPEYRGKLVFIQLALPGETHVEAQREIQQRVDELVHFINHKYACGSWRPIVYEDAKISPQMLSAFYRIADFCIASSLQDGMNLVAKEYVSSRVDEDGVLILSRFAGAAAELKDALLVNPYATDEFAETIKQALEMPGGVRRRTMRKMREIAMANNVYHWSASIISQIYFTGTDIEGLIPQAIVAPPP